jgi:hypothetical protein
MAGFGLGNYINPGVGSWIDQRRNTLAGLGAGLLNGQPGAGVQAGLQADSAYAVQQQAESEREANLNQTQKWLRDNYPQFANLPAAEGWQAAMAEMTAKRSAAMGSQDPASIREWQTFNALTPEQQQLYLRMKRANPYLDVGTGFVQPDPVNPGQISGPAITKDNFTPAYDSALGGASAKVDIENQSAFDSLNSKMPGLRTVIAELGQLAKTATYTTAGRLVDDVRRETGMEPTEAAVARAKYISMVDNQILPLLRDTFGAQFTQKEGETLRETLGDPNKSPLEKQAVLEAFIAQKQRDLEAMQTRLPGTSATNDPLGIR